MTEQKLRRPCLCPRLCPLHYLYMLRRYPLSLFFILLITLLRTKLSPQQCRPPPSPCTSRKRTWPPTKSR